MVRSIDGRGFAFVPREVVAQPKAFGLAPGLLDPAHDVDETSERYRAAMVQHVMAATVRAALLRSRGLAPTAFAARFPERGLGADRVRRVFRGETMAQLTDLMFWMGHFPEVAEAISEQTTAWFGLTKSVAGPTMLAEESPLPPEPRLQARRMDSLRDPVVAQGKGPGAPPVRRSPENPYTSAPRGIRPPLR